MCIMNVARWRPSRGYPGNFITYPVSDDDFIYMMPTRRPPSRYYHYIKLMQHIQFYETIYIEPSTFSTRESLAKARFVTLTSLTRSSLTFTFHWCEHRELWAKRTVNVSEPRKARFPLVEEIDGFRYMKTVEWLLVAWYVYNECREMEAVAWITRQIL